MANIFFTVVGTGPYAPDNYCLDGYVYKDRFVQKALLSILKKKGEHFDKIVVFLTDSARAMNWEKFKRERRDKNGNIEQITDEGLQPFLEREFPGIHEAPYIPDGNNEEEIMEMFMTMYDHIGKGDEITFDITHGFRFIPLLFYPVMSYAKELKNITIKHIYYGLHQNGVENSAILDLKRYDDILDCANAAHTFINSGDSSEIAKVINDRIKAVNDVEQKKMLSSSNNMTKHLGKLTNALLTCQGGKNDIRKSAEQVAEHRTKVENSINIESRIFSDIIFHAADSVSNLSADAPEYELAMNSVEWYKERGLIMQAYTALRESITTFFVCTYAPEFSIVDSVFRTKVADRVVTTLAKFDSGEKTIRDNVVRLLNDRELSPENRKKWAALYMKMIRHADMEKMKYIGGIIDVRNAMDHFGMNNEKGNPGKLGEYISKTKELFKDINDRKDEILTDEAALALIEKPGSKEIFVNFSNHPSANWSSQQVEAAKALCGSESANIVDIQFPAVPADADEKQISALAAEYTGKIAEYAPAPVMCMGEWGVCCEVVRRLKEMGITVVYSCSERVVTEVVRDGKTEKTSQFNFVRFRKY